MISSQVRVLYCFYQFVNTRYISDFCVINTVHQGLSFRQKKYLLAKFIIAFIRKCQPILFCAIKPICNYNLMGCLSVAMTGSFKQINWCFSEKLMLQKKRRLIQWKKDWTNCKFIQIFFKSTVNYVNMNTKLCAKTVLT